MFQSQILLFKTNIVNLEAGCYVHCNGFVENCENASKSCESRVLCMHLLVPSVTCFATPHGRLLLERLIVTKLSYLHTFISHRISNRCQVVED